MSGASLLSTLFVGSIVYLCLRSIGFLLDKFRIYRTWKRLNVDGPPVTSLIYGHMHESDSNEVVRRWHQQYGKIFGLYSMHTPQIRVNDCELINEIFLKQSRVFSGRIKNDLRFTALLKSILFAEGERWAFIRKLLSPSLGQYRIKIGDASNKVNINDEFRSEYNDIESGTKRLIRHWQQQPKQVQRVEVLSTMQALTLDVIFRIAFNQNIIDVTKGAEDETVQQIRSIMRLPEHWAVRLLAAVPFLRPFIGPYMVLFSEQIYQLKKLQQSIRDNMDWTSASKQVHKNNNNHDANNNNHEEHKRIYHVLVDNFKLGKLSFKELNSNIMALLVAGYETTSTSTTYVLWILARHPDVQERLRFDTGEYGLESTYLDMVIKETMRLYTALPNFVMRSANQPISIGTSKGKIEIEHGTEAVMSLASLHYDENHWPDPWRFDPERFAPGQTRHPCAFAPFGLGHRMCAGYQMALREMKTIVCLMLANYELRLIGPERMQVSSQSAFLTRPVEEVMIDFVPLGAKGSDT